MLTRNNIIRILAVLMIAICTIVFQCVLGINAIGAPTDGILLGLLIVGVMSINRIPVSIRVSICGSVVFIGALNLVTKAFSSTF